MLVKLLGTVPLVVFSIGMAFYASVWVVSGLWGDKRSPAGLLVLLPAVGGVSLGIVAERVLQTSVIRALGMQFLISLAVFLGLWGCCRTALPDGNWSGGLVILSSSEILVAGFTFLGAIIFHR